MALGHNPGPLPAGRIQGTMGRDHMAFLPASSSLRVVGTMHTWLPPPSYPRVVTVYCTPRPTAVLASGAFLYQQRQGTLGQTMSGALIGGNALPSLVGMMWGYALPGLGSYTLGTFAGKAPLINLWREYDP